MLLGSLLSKEAVFYRLNAVSKKQALKSLAASAEPITGLDAADIYEVLMEREQAGCTGVGEGICIPHGRFEDLQKSCTLFATLDHPVEFGAADGRPVDVVCLLLTPITANTEHIKSMALISRFLRDRRFVQAVREAKDRDDLYKVLTRDRRKEVRA